MPVSSKQSINRILDELQDQQRINEAALDMLKKKIIRDTSIANSPIKTFQLSSNSINLPKRSSLTNSSNSISAFIKPATLSTNYLAKPYNMLDDSLSPDEIRYNNQLRIPKKNFYRKF